MSKDAKYITIDTWKTGLHGEKIGIKQKEQWMSKSRAFTRYMDIIGRIKQEQENYGLIGIRKSIWNEETKEKQLNNKLVLRIFSNEGKWLGSIEEMITWELGQSIAVDNQLPHFVIILSNYDYMINLSKVHQRVTMRESYTFELINQKNESVNIFEIKSERISLGSDWTVYFRNSKEDRKIATLDTKFVDLGGKVKIEIKDEEFINNEILKKVLILFSITIKYHDNIKNNIKLRLEELSKGKGVFSPTKSELWLMRNPRRYIGQR